MTPGSNADLNLLIDLTNPGLIIDWHKNPKVRADACASWSRTDDVLEGVYFKGYGRSRVVWVRYLTREILIMARVELSLNSSTSIVLH